jgi:streptogramin lyase
MGQQIRVGEHPASIAVGAGYVWVPSPGEGTVWRIDESSGERAQFHVGGDPGPAFISVGEGGVWMTVR